MRSLAQMEKCPGNPQILQG